MADLPETEVNTPSPAGDPDVVNPQVENSAPPTIETLQAEIAAKDEKIKSLASSSKWWSRGYWLMAAVVYLGPAMSMFTNARNEEKVFGEEASLAGKAIRQFRLATCDDCATVDDLLVPVPASPSRKAAGEVLQNLMKDPHGKLLVENARDIGVRFEGDSKGFADSCTADAFFDSSYGIVGYTLGKEEGVKDAAQLQGEMTHELFHAAQKIRYLPYAASKKDLMIYRMTLEAAAYAFTDVMEAKKDYWKKHKAEPKEEDVLVAAKKSMNTYMFSDRFTGLRQSYLLSYGPSFADYDTKPSIITLDALKKIALLPGGKPFLPDDATIAKIDFQIRTDLYNDIVQRKPVGVVKDAKAGNAGAQDDEAKTEKSVVQEWKDTTCKKRADKMKPYRPGV